MSNYKLVLRNIGDNLTERLSLKLFNCQFRGRVGRTTHDSLAELFTFISNLELTIIIITTSITTTTSLLGLTVA
jgi:hypothetical protein